MSFGPLLTAASLAGTALSAVGQVRAGQAQARQLEASRQASEFNAAISRQQAARERAAAAEEAVDFERDERRKLASLRARLAGSGVAMEGSPLLVESEASALIDEGVQRILRAGSFESERLEQEAQLSTMTGQSASRAGRTARTTGFINAGQSLLTGFSNTFADRVPVRRAGER